MNKFRTTQTRGVKSKVKEDRQKQQEEEVEEKHFTT